MLWLQKTIFIGENRGLKPSITHPAPALSISSQERFLFFLVPRAQSIFRNFFLRVDVGKKKFNLDYLLH